MEKELYDNYLNTGQIKSTDQLTLKSQYCNYIYNKFFNGIDKKDLIVDLACGYGEMVFYLEKMGYSNIKGVEVSKELVNLSKSLGVINVIEGDIFTYLELLEDNTIKVVIIKDIIEHLDLENVGKLIKLINRKLITNGFIIGHTPNGAGIFGMLVKYNDLTHKVAYTQKSIEQLAKICGFNTIEVYEDKPLSAGVVGLVRRLIWMMLTTPIRFLYYIESGNAGIILSQNITFRISNKI